jgi:hypothetical protein
MRHQASGEGIPDSRISGKMREALTKSRRSMLDLTRRNRLLHAPLEGKRAACLVILHDAPDNLFLSLTQKNAEFTFAASSAFDENEALLIGSSARYLDVEAKAPKGSVQAKAHSQNSNTKNFLHTKLDEKTLDKRLTKIFRDARSLEEEQGLSTLYLVIGYLRWCDSDHSGETSTAPLILIPVALERGKIDKYVLKNRGEEVLSNASLREKLKTEFGLSLPELPQEEEWEPSQYLSEVEAAIASQRKWVVDATAIGLGFFAFSKFMMWKDLDPDTWTENSLLSHPLLKALLSSDTSVHKVPSSVSDEEKIDKKIDLAAAVHVVDADSSQAIVIDEAIRGRNLVVQGPPGTGKSQTITNIIAGAVHAGKSVLFVAEKSSALGVVKNRLQQCKLGSLCLELHSKKASKQEVYASLEAALHVLPPVQANEEIKEVLAETRDLLNESADVLHQEIGQSGCRPYYIIGTQLRYRDEFLPTQIALHHVGEWDRIRIVSRKMAR